MTSLGWNLLVWVVLRGAEGRVLLGRRDGSAYGHGLWGLPGGRVEGNEALLDAARREVREEIGVEVRDLGTLGVRRYAVDGARGTDFLFLTDSWEGEPEPLHKTSEVGWFFPDALPDDTLPWIGPLLDLHLRRGVLVSEQLASPDEAAGLPVLADLREPAPASPADA